MSKASSGRRAAWAIFVAGLSGPLMAGANDAGGSSQGMVSYQSDASFAETLERVQSAVESRGLFLMRVMDHSGGAAKFGIDLPPNSVAIFGNPKIGSQLMKCEPRIGIDLPQKLLIWEEQGQVTVAYNSPSYLKERHRVEGCDEILDQVRENLDAIARSVSGK